MRLKEVEFNLDTLTAEIDVKGSETPFIMIVSNGKVKKVELPLFGEIKVITHQGKVTRVRFEEGEEF